MFAASPRVRGAGLAGSRACPYMCVCVYVYIYIYIYIYTYVQITNSRVATDEGVT